MTTTAPTRRAQREMPAPTRGDRRRHIAGSPTNPRGSFWTRLRATSRLAVRQVVRTPGSSLLVIGLISLPIFALTGGLIYFESHHATPPQQVAYTLGSADARIQIAGPPNETRWQDPANLWSSSTMPDKGEAPTGLPAMVPSSAGVIGISEGMTPLMTTVNGAASFAVIEGPMWDKRFAGAFRITAGTAPAKVDDVLVTSGVLERLGAKIGDTLTSSSLGGATPVTVTITGTVGSINPSLASGGFIAPQGSPLATDTYGESWFVFGWQPTLDQLVTLNHDGYVAFARDLVLDGATHPDATYAQDNGRASTYVLGVIGGCFFALLVGLIGGAAMSVSARRQQRSLAMAASVGAGRGSLFAVVIGQGIVLGLVAAVIGIGLGAAAAALILAALDDGDPWSPWGNWGFHMPIAPIIFVACLAVIVGTVSAIFPARTATRGDVLAALRGARRPVTLRRAMPRWGVGILLAGLASSIGGIVVLATSITSRTNELITLATVLVIAGPLLLILGTALCGHWLLTVIARLASRAGVATRLALRDLAANPSRTIPAFLAIATAMLVATAALSINAITYASNTRTYSWSAPLHSVVFQTWGSNAAGTAAAADRARDLAAGLGAQQTAVLSSTDDAAIDPATNEVIDPDQLVTGLGVEIGTRDCTDNGMECIDGWLPNGGALTVIAADQLPVATGVTLTTSQRAAFESGSALTTTSRMWGETKDRVRAYVGPASAMVQGDGGAIRPWSSAITYAEFPVIILDDLRMDATYLISPQTAEKLGVTTHESAIVAKMNRPLTPAESDRLTAATADSGLSSIYANQEKGPDSGIQWLALIAAITGAIVLGTAVVTLGLARFERRPDDATLTAVGGKTGMRRRVNAVQALTMVGLGSLIGAGIGLLPTLAYVSTSGTDYFPLATLPWAWIIGLAVALPLLLAAIAWLVPPRKPDLVRREAIT